MAATRTYTKRLRAEGEQETRQRIVEAIMSLHEDVGPARTTVSGIAERAGVQRLTVYRHFPDDASMLRACSAHWAELHPLPLPPIDGAQAGGALRALYAWYRQNAAMLSNVCRDAQAMPLVKTTLQGMEDALDELAARIDRGYGRRSADRRRTIRHAVAFATWQSLSALTRDDRKAAELALKWIEACA
ncbi:MAG TPA: helix-turn-helix domain-containing protein [Thermoanaerobaculia bacterium]|nr:helix-turn-helix domain-containing protein [Thermoanaerobaculia bacterium]